MNDIAKLTVLFYEILGRLLTSSHKTLYAIMCRNIHRQLKASGVTLVPHPSEPIH